MRVIVQRRDVLTALATVAAFAISGCANASSRHGSEIRKRNVDKTELENAVNQMLKDMDEYELSDEMLEYTSYVSDHMHLISDQNTSQEHVDYVVEEIKHLRQIAIGSYAVTDVNSVEGVSYKEFIEMAPDSIGKNYHIEGRITHVTGSFTSDYWELYVRWNDSEDSNETIYIRIAQSDHKSEIRKYFSGDCTFLGFEKRKSRPVFTCTSAYSGR